MAVCEAETLLVGGCEEEATHIVRTTNQKLLVCEPHGRQIKATFFRVNLFPIMMSDEEAESLAASRLCPCGDNDVDADHSRCARFEGF